MTGCKFQFHYSCASLHIHFNKNSIVLELIKQIKQLLHNLTKHTKQK